jgi:hypothetical protein
VRKFTEKKPAGQSRAELLEPDQAIAVCPAGLLAAFPAQ